MAVKQNNQIEFKKDYEYLEQNLDMKITIWQYKPCNAKVMEMIYNNEVVKTKK